MNTYLKKKRSSFYIFDDDDTFSSPFLEHFSYKYPNKEKDFELFIEEDKIGPEPNLKYDIVKRVITSRFVDNDIHKMVCLVEFLKRPNGFQPKPMKVTSVDLKKYAPRQLAEYYETKL